MGTVDRAAMCRRLYPVLLERAAGGTDERNPGSVVAAAVEGYPFPSDLDRDQPIDGRAPPTQADVLHTALRHRWSRETFEAALQAQVVLRTGAR